MLTLTNLHLWSCDKNVDFRYCAAKEENSDTVYIVAEAFRETLLQMLGRELQVVAQFDGEWWQILSQ